MSTTSFNQTLQFITSVKLAELEKQRAAFHAHAKVIDEANALGRSSIERVERLLAAVRSAPSAGAASSTLSVAGGVSLANLDLWIAQAKSDPSISPAQIAGWADALEQHLRHSEASFDYARLFGQLFTEWLQSADTSTPASNDNGESAQEDFEEVGRKDGKHSREAVPDLLLTGDTRRVNVVDTRADLVRVAVVLESVQELHVALRRLDRDDICVQVLDGSEDVVKVGVAEVRVGLQGIGDTCGSELERRKSPVEVSRPVNLAERETFTESGLINLDGADTSLLEINDLVTKSKSQLLGLNLTRDVVTGERPVEDGNGASKHTLHRLVGETLSVL